MAKTVLITGGTGFLGCHLARRFLKEGWSVTLLDIAPLEANDLFGKVTVVNCDIRNKKKLEHAFKQQQYIVHAAAALPIIQEKKEIFSVNIDGTKNVLEVAFNQQVKRLVFISTTAVYGVPKHLPELETSPLDPIGDYGKSKIEGEKLCSRYMAKGVQINIIRPKTFLGPERLGVFQLWFEAMYKNKRVFILGSGNNPYQLLAVSDVVDAIYKAITIRKHGEIFNVGAKDFTTLRKDLEYIVRQAKSKSIVTGFPVLLSQLILATLEKFHLSPIAAWHYKTLPAPSYVAIKKAERILNWYPQKSNRQLLLETYTWYKSNRNTIIQKVGTTHRVGWNFKLLHLITRFF